MRQGYESSREKESAERERERGDGDDRMISTNDKMKAPHEMKCSILCVHKLVKKHHESQQSVKNRAKSTRLLPCNVRLTTCQELFQLIHSHLAHQSREFLKIY